MPDPVNTSAAHSARYRAWRWHLFHHPAKLCWRLASALYRWSDRVDSFGNRLNHKAW